MNWTTIIVIAIVLITLDKGITVMNIKAVEKNHPEVDRLSIERNPLAKASFEKLGLAGGSIVYWVFSLATFFFALYLFSYPAGVWAPDNKWGVALYAMMMFYSFVIMNNFYFFLRYSKLL